jgi:hypothetical protein
MRFARYPKGEPYQMTPRKLAGAREPSRRRKSEGANLPDAIDRKIAPAGDKAGELLINRDDQKTLSRLNHCLRFLFLAAFFVLRAFLLHLSKRLRHVFELIPNIKAYIDRRGLLSRHRDAIARPCIDLDDLLLLQFVL